MLRSLEEPETLDVLGLGAVRDAFSEMLSPGTSTIQTRLRPSTGIGSNRCFKSVHPARVDELRPESLDLLRPDVLGQVDTLYAFDDCSVPDLI